MSQVRWTGDGITICGTEQERGHGPVQEHGHKREPKTGCAHCCQTAMRRAQIWEECSHCGFEPIYV